MKEDAPLRDVLVLLGDPRQPDDYKRNDQFNAEDLENVEVVKRSLSALGRYRFQFHDEHPTLIDRLRQDPPDLVLNLCDTGFNNDALLELHVPALCDLLGIPCTGAGAAGMVLVYDKAIVRAVAAEHGVPVPAQLYLGPEEELRAESLPLPALIKPSCADGSLGITKDAVVRDLEAARRYVGWVRAELPGRALLVQEFLSGNEYGVGLIGNPGDGFTVLPPLEVDYSGLDPSLPQLLGYESKAHPDSPYWTDVGYRKAESLPEDEYRRMAGWCELLFERLQCRDYGRFDFRADASGQIKLMEANTNPAWAHDAKLNLMTSFGGRTHSDMFAMILATAEKRVHRERAARM